MSSRPGSLVAAALLCLSCAGAVMPPAEARDDAERTRIESLTRSVEMLAQQHTNLGRYSAVGRRVAELGLADRSQSEWIDWFSLQRNLWIEIPGTSERLVYVVAHYDKVDANPLSAVSTLLNGALDPVISPLYLSAGAVDNATGVAVALELAAELARKAGTEQPFYTYRILLVGSEESGLRGSRAHVARLSREEKDAIELALIVDSVGVSYTPNCVIDAVSDPDYVASAKVAARELGIPLESARLPGGASSDFEPFAHTSFAADFLRGLRFNLLGGLLPQRSWFTGQHRAPVLFFCGCELLDTRDFIVSQLLLPLGSLHGARDRADRVDPRRLHDQLAIASAVLQELERRSRSSRVQ